MKKNSPTYRAGINLKDETRSGFARVSVIDQEDLFPNEGYEFPPALSKKPPTNSYRVSADSPFQNYHHPSSFAKDHQSEVINKSMGAMIRTERLCTRAAAKAIATPTPGELRPIHSKIAEQAIKKERDEQVKIREELRMAKMKDDAYWEQVEQDEAESTLKINSDSLTTKHLNQKSLASDYKKQFYLHDKVKEEEKYQEQLEADKLHQMQIEDQEKEKERQAKLRAIASERKKEFQLRNDELLQRRQKRIEQDIEEERKLAIQSAEIEKTKEQRETTIRARREEKNRRRDLLIEQQSKALEEMKRQQQNYNDKTESEISKLEEADRRKRLEKIKQANREQRDAYKEFKIQKDLEMSRKITEPDFTDDGDEEARKYDREMKHLQSIRVQRELKQQILARREAERRERLQKQQHADNMFFLKDNEW